MSLGKVHARILIAGAWIAGMGVATGGSLYAVSLLGQGILATSSQQLNVAAVNRALASEAGEPSGSPSDPPPSSGHKKRAPSRPRPASPPQPAPATSSATSSAATGTLLTSAGGNVVAGCAAAGAYLLSWVPQQGYEATSAVRGPAPHAEVTFRSGRTQVVMVVTCRGGVPTASSSVDNSWGGDD